MTTAQVDNTIGSKITSDQATCNYEMTLAPEYTVTQLETRSNEISVVTWNTPDRLFASRKEIAQHKMVRIQSP